LKTFLEQNLLNLDLHGVRHHEVKVIVEDFILNNQEQLPLIIICGNSSKMIELVSQTLKDISVNFEETKIR
jgi:Sulfite reductase, alpha subunit (flavoprotein)